MANIDKIQVGETTYDIVSSSNGTNTFTSGDVADGSATAWTTVAALTSGETTSSILSKVSNMFKNIRYLYSTSLHDRLKKGTGTLSVVVNDIEDSDASGERAYTEGYNNYAYGDYSHAEGLTNEAQGEASHAEGSGSYANGDYSHAEGTSTASGNCSHSEGNSTVASGYYSHAAGFGTVANHASQHVFGEYNIEDSSTLGQDERGDYVEIVGNGTTDTNKSNARTLDWDGNESLAGSLTLGMGTTAAVTLTPAILNQLINGGSNPTYTNVTLASANWTLNNTSGYYTQSVTVSGVTSTSKFKINGIVYPSGTTLDSKAGIDFAASLLLNGDTQANSIVFNAVEKPDTDFTIEIEVK